MNFKRLLPPDAALIAHFRGFRNSEPSVPFPAMHRKRNVDLGLDPAQSTFRQLWEQGGDVRNNGELRWFGEDSFFATPQPKRR